MRIIYLLLLIVPCLVQAQVNRSAKELASENIKEYIETKLFKDMPYKAVSYGELKTYKQPQTGKEWVLEHNFEITETRLQADKKNYNNKALSFFLLPRQKNKSVGGLNG